MESRGPVDKLAATGPLVQSPKALSMALAARTPDCASQTPHRRSASTLLSGGWSESGKFDSR